MVESQTEVEAASLRTPWARVPLVAAALSMVVGVILLAFAWPAVTASARDLPVGIVGSDAHVDQVTDAVEREADGAVSLIRYDDRDAATAAIERREAYGAIVLGEAPREAPEVLTATAASAQVAQLMDGLAQKLQAQVDEQVRSAIEANLQHAQEAAVEKTRAAIQAAVQAALTGSPLQPPTTDAMSPIELPSVTVKVTDVVPFADTDPRGAGLTAAMFPLVLGGMIGGIGLTLLVKGGGGRRAIGLAVYSIAAGLVLAGVLQGAFGALHGDFWVNSAAIAVSVAAIGGTITGLAGLIGPAGVGIGAAFTILLANPISAATLPVEFLASPWGAIGQQLPPGAASTLLRSLSYFPAADVSSAWWLLIVWALAGLVLTTFDVPGRRRGNRSGRDVENRHPASSPL